MDNEYKKPKTFTNPDIGADLKNTDKNKPQEDSVKDLKESLKQTVEETLQILDKLLQEVDNGVKDESSYKETKKIVSSINTAILNAVNKEGKIPDSFLQDNKEVLAEEE
jgi:hypothetical protein